MQLWSIIAGGILLCSCTLFENPVTLGRSRRDTEGRLPGKNTPPQQQEDTVSHIYLSIVEYPKGYDWIRDTAHSTVDARLLLFRDGVCTRTIKTGDPEHVSTDPDTHHILDGRLYTTFCDGVRTYIKRDGEELFYFNSAEDIKGMILKDGLLWTLGQKIRGQGFALRCDGAAVSENQQGELIGSLYEDDGDLCFAYGITVQAGNYVLHKYFMSIGGEEREVSIPSDATAVFDIRRCNRVNYAVYRQSSVPNDPVLSTDSSQRSLYSGQHGIRDCGWGEILPIGNDILIKGWYDFTEGERRYVLWNKNGVRNTYAPTIAIQEFFGNDEGSFAAIGYDRRTGETLLYAPPFAAYKINLGTHYRFVSRKTGALIGEKLYICLTGEEENALWINDQKTPLSIYGPVTAFACQ